VARVYAGARSAPGVLGSAVGDALGIVRSADPRLLGALAWWGFDAAVLWSMLNAFGSPPALAVVVLAYFVGQVANTIPVPGAASGGLVGVLLAFGVDADLALGSVLAYRAVAIWLPTPIGLVALTGLRRTVGRWAHEDEAKAPQAVARPEAVRSGAPPEAVPAASARPAMRPPAARPVTVPAGAWAMAAYPGAWPTPGKHGGTGGTGIPDAALQAAA
jgi:hypothetical protein